MKKRIFASICSIALGSLVLFCLCTVILVRQKALQNGYASLQADAAQMAAGLTVGGEEYLSGIKGYAGRITHIAANGTVLYDDREDAAAMENHAARPEIAQALETGVARARRQSSTLGEATLYYALRLEDGTVLRLSMQAGGIAAQVAQFVPWLLLVAALIVAAAALVAGWQTRRILAPINQMDLDAPLQAEAYDELAPLMRKIAVQKQALARQMENLHHQQEEFASLTENMEEGLLVVNKSGAVITINPSACRMLGVAAPPKGPTPLLGLGRHLQLAACARRAAEGRRLEETLPLNGREYRVVASPTAGGGAILLLADETEKLRAEQTRREFSANVSHELKTPLTSISGYAEILAGGLVQPGDVPQFAAKIYDEAARMIALVGDIIRLSQLDERQQPAAKGPVALLRLAHSVAASLDAPAAEKEVRIRVDGEEVEVDGVAPVLTEIVYNLVENAIRYNHTGGQVVVTVGRRDSGAFIEVQDTGIGIPAQHQPHIFQRFYRVDKSHSRESGGTGLGLSIVKRGALYHGGRVQLQSTPGRGSVFTVWLPPE